ncbi:MAG: DUF45 domain-containing protein, partial [Parabacteroides sp.]|nr:DUF45 domain-containing protein [Parabacteroides sp.]
MNNRIQIIRSNRRSISIEIKKDLTIIVRAPFFVKTEEINKFIDSKKSWIDKHINNIQQRQLESSTVKKVTPEEVKELADKALNYIPQRVSYYSPIIGVDYGRITIRNQVSR